METFVPAVNVPMIDTDVDPEDVIVENSVPDIRRKPFTYTSIASEVESNVPIEYAGLLIVVATV